MDKSYNHFSQLLFLFYIFDFFNEMHFKEFKVDIKTNINTFFIKPNIFIQYYFFSLNICKCHIFYQH